MFRIRLKEARERAGYTQKQLSLLIGKSDGVVGNWEAGSREPDLATIRKLADVLKIKVSDLVDDPIPPGKKKEGPSTTGETFIQKFREMFGRDPNDSDIARAIRHLQIDAEFQKKDSN